MKFIGYLHGSDGIIKLKLHQFETEVTLFQGLGGIRGFPGFPVCLIQLSIIKIGLAGCNGLQND